MPGNAVMLFRRRAVWINWRVPKDKPIAGDIARGDERPREVAEEIEKVRAPTLASSSSSRCNEASASEKCVLHAS